MTKIKYDVSDVEAGQDFDTPIPVGLYKAKVKDCEEGTSKSSGNPMLTITYEVSSGDWKGRNLWDYIVLNDSSAWKLRQFLEAIGEVNGKKASGTFETKKALGSRVQVHVKHESDDEFGTRAKVKSVVPMPEDAADEDDDEPESEDVEPEADDEEDEELTWADIQGYDREELEAVVEENELDVTFNSRTKDDVLRERIAEELELSEDDDEDEPDDDDDDEAEDYSDWDPKDLRTELKSRGLATKGPKPALVKRLERDDASDDGAEPF